MSEYIEKSKHAAGTAAVTAHFGGANQGRMPGTDPLLKAPPGGDADWNPPQGSIDSGQTNTASPGVSGRSIFNAPGQSLPRETGVNYTQRDNAGHTTHQDPFSLADGFPGN